MITLKNWTAKRSGATITIKHESGYISRVKEIAVFGPQVIAVTLDGISYILELGA
jgi:hypothetical protein